MTNEFWAQTRGFIGVPSENVCISFQKLNTKGTSALALFGVELDSPSVKGDTDITLIGQDPVLPGAANITLMVPRGGLDSGFP